MKTEIGDALCFGVVASIIKRAVWIISRTQKRFSCTWKLWSTYTRFVMHILNILKHQHISYDNLCDHHLELDMHMHNSKRYKYFHSFALSSTMCVYYVGCWHSLRLSTRATVMDAWINYIHIRAANPKRWTKQKETMLRKKKFQNVVTEEYVCVHFIHLSHHSHHHHHRHFQLHSSSLIIWISWATLYNPYLYDELMAHYAHCIQYDHDHDDYSAIYCYWMKWIQTLIRWFEWWFFFVCRLVHFSILRPFQNIITSYLDTKGPPINVWNTECHCHAWLSSLNCCCFVRIDTEWRG